jgi:hypothetical protein
MSPLKRFDDADWTGIPHHLHHQIEDYVADGTPPESPFLGDILTGDLRRACSRVPERENLFAIVDFLGLYMPIEAWGHAGACVRWGELGGQRGIAQTDTSRMYESRKRGPVYLWRPGINADRDYD